MPQWGSWANAERQVEDFLVNKPDGATFEEVKRGVKTRIVGKVLPTLVFHKALFLLEGRYYHRKFK